MMNKLLKKPIMYLMLVAIFSMALSGSAYAHKGNDDWNKHNEKNSIDAATAVTLIVKGLDLNIDNIRFIKEPKASDYYTKVKDNASYAGSFIIAQFNGLDLPKDINPSAKVTREQFVKWLFGALSHKGDYAWIEIFQEIADANQVTKGYMDSIQKLLIAKIVTLDNKQKFHPKNSVTTAEASTMIARTVNFIKNTKPAPIPETPVLNDVKLTSDKESDTVTRVTIAALAPNPGYGIEITGIQFVKGEAIISYKAVLPDPDKMFAQVITEVKAVTYVPSSYKPVLGQLQPSDSVSAGSNATSVSSGQ
ncbi:S-layer homology domain-containing protein [Cohnella silvisoli]|uniref:S-layer homology domain-containing protein n=1 Tax=Cohnella silvisoli TaxID=2873699 RepID=A0ABV1KYW3_9BACL|nr:S-layer homology domain-containing protein [Cohnella silvisoli]MCD9024296.1 S-layer homology domain-containing protein [Cohnella silvisoli]